MKLDNVDAKVEELEIDMHKARRLSAIGSKVIWVLGEPDILLSNKISLLSEKFEWVYPHELLAFENNAISKIGSNSILVCNHGNTSLVIAKKLRDKGIVAYSLKGGVSSMR